MELIVLIDRRGGIGRDGRQPLIIPQDLARFRRLTLGHAVILGRKTLDALPGGKPLPGRQNLVLTRDPQLTVPGAQVFCDLASLLRAAPADSFVIGGASVYRQLLPCCTTAHVTRVDADMQADRFFPDLATDPGWVLADASPQQQADGLRWRFLTYQRI